MWFPNAFDITKDINIFSMLIYSAIYSKNLLFSHSIVLVNNKGEVAEQTWQSVTRMNEIMKNVIIHVSYFLNDPMVNLLFDCQISIY